MGDDSSENKGFTLIELLAVIVILAIIALIATPIILNIIKETKEESNKRSIEMYAKALENAITKYQLDGKKLGVNKLITTDGRNFSNIDNFKVEYDGNVVCDVIEINEDGNIFLGECKINNSKKEYTLGIQKEGPEHLSRNNVRPVTNPTTGIIPIQEENGNIKPGSEFKIKVSDDIKDENDKIVEYSFFVLSNSEDGKYVNLIAEKNLSPDGVLTGENQIDDEWYAYDTKNRYGPQTAYTYLNNSTIRWVNIPMIENFYYEDEGYKEKSSYGYQNIKTEFKTGKYITTITPYSEDYGNPKTYENMRARLPYEEEIKDNTSCTGTPGSCDDESLWVVDNLYPNTYVVGFVTGLTLFLDKCSGYWISTSYSITSNRVYVIDFNGNCSSTEPNDVDHGVRPVITVLKSDLLRVMN